MKEIHLTQGKVALVDDADYEWLMQWKWYAQKNRRTYYAVRRTVSLNGVHETILMHRQILGLSFGDPREGDHREHDGLDNRRLNLRIVNHRQNQWNQRKAHRSRFPGVRWNKYHEKWQVCPNIHGKERFIGYFVEERTASEAYQNAIAGM